MGGHYAGESFHRGADSVIIDPIMGNQTKAPRPDHANKHPLFRKVRGDVGSLKGNLLI
jgi:hypothetical protein